MSGTGQSRRGLLGRGAAALAAVVGVGAGVGATASRTGADAGSTRRTVRLDGRGWSLTTPGKRVGERIEPGDRSTVHGELLENGRVVGTFLGSRLAAPSAPGGLNADAALELHTFTFPGGTILGMGSALPGSSVYAIVGGSGAYADARGSYTAEQRSFELGGDGSASFVLTLTA
jgi:hypothetical protein